MAGNTKMMGFSTDGIQLERWGGKATIPLSPESLAAVRDACYQQLPRKPRQRKRDDLADFNVQYNDELGRVVVDLDPETAALLARRLEASKATLGLLSKEEAARSGDWISSLKEGVQAHIDYHNRDNEPGVADEESES